LESLKFRSALILASVLSSVLCLTTISFAAELSQARRAQASATPTPAAPSLQMSLVYPTNGVLNVGGPETIQAQVTVGPPPSMPINKYRVVIAVTNSKGRVVRHHAFHPVANQSIANLDMKSVPAGSYNVTAEVFHHGQRLTGTNPYGVTKEGPTPTPIESATPTPIGTGTPTPSPTTTPRRTPTPTPKPTATSTKTPTPTRTATGTATSTPKPTSTATPAPTATGTPVASGLDQYGGTTSVQCSNGAAPHFYTEKIGNRWWICDPAGNGYFMKQVADMVTNVDSEQYALNQTKYATGPTSIWQLNWSLEQINRLQSWGFNTSDGYFPITPFNTDPRWGTADNEIPIKMPSDYSSNISRYVFQNSDNCSVASAVKDMANGVTTNPVFTGYGGYSYGDYFDPNFSICVGDLLAATNVSLNSIATGVHNDYLIMITIDEGDQTGGMFAPGPDYPPLGSVTLGANAAWVTLATAPTQTGTSSTSRQNWLNGGSYTDTTVHTKQELSTWL